jgi:hypothetical protein
LNWFFDGCARTGGADKAETSGDLATPLAAGVIAKPSHVRGCLGSLLCGALDVAPAVVWCRSPSLLTAPLRVLHCSELPACLPARRAAAARSPARKAGAKCNERGGAACLSRCHAGVTGHYRVQICGHSFPGMRPALRRRLVEISIAAAAPTPVPRTRTRKVSPPSLAFPPPPALPEGRTLPWRRQPSTPC